ncbi:MAG TPA: hypothetical protein DHW82_07185 [Spirochaetia bacterium]|nr:MAG: hypothetical protein A2Y41_10975 [Spirochaetes bacterium GWB1_36_13]HCL56777.1 hypothetical protein [Spirochaetia bacterium]
MLGFTDFSIGIVYLLTIFSGLGCLAYGFKNWNKGDEPMTERDKEWAEEEIIRLSIVENYFHQPSCYTKTNLF